MAKKQKNFKRCPRCDTKAKINQPKCEMCGLVYARMTYATNREAKKALRKRQKHLVVYDKTLPKDINKWKLFCMALFLGLFGGHRFYVGKIKGGIYSIVAIMMLFISVSLPQSWWAVWYLSLVIWIFIFPAGPNVVWWVWDWIAILSNKYKVPVAIEEANLIAAKEIENKEVLKIVKDLDKQAKDQVQEQKESENKEEKILEDNLNPTIVKENVNKGNLGKKTQPKKVQKAKKEQEIQEDEPFVPKSKVISSEEVKRLINKNQRKTNNNQSKKKK